MRRSKLRLYIWRIGSLLQRGVVAHPEIGPEMLRQQVDGGAIVLRIGLRQVAHGLHQHSLAFNIPRVRLALTLDIFGSGNDWNREEFGHECVGLDVLTNSW